MTQSGFFFVFFGDSELHVMYQAKIHVTDITRSKDRDKKKMRDLNDSTEELDQ